MVVPAEWTAETLTRAEFSGAGAGTAPLTWAQQVLWRSITRFGSNHRFLNLRRTIAVSVRAGVDVAGAVRAVGALVGRHSALRTRLRVVDGEPHQETVAAGVLPLLLRAGVGDGAEAAREAAGRLGDVAFDHTAEWPLRVALVTVDDRVRQVVVVFSHTTVDAHAAELVLRDLRLLLLRGGLSTPPGPQSADVARRQHGVDRRRSERAIGHWLREFPRLPRSPLTPTGPGLDPPLRRGVLVSSAVDTAARMIAARHRVSVSAVLLTGFQALAVRDGGQDVSGLFPMAHNRFRAEYANAVANLGQIGFCVVDLAGRPDFTELLSRVWAASLDGLRHAYYDPPALRRAFEERGVDYDTAFLPHHYFNDVRLPVGGVGAVPEATPAELRAAMDRSTFSWTAGLHQASWHLLAHVVDEPGGVGITLTVDTRHRAMDSVEPLLRGLEELLVRAAFADVPWPWSSTGGAPVGGTPTGTVPIDTAPTRSVGAETEEVAYARFAGGRDASAPLTWGQRAMWRSVDEFEAPAAYRALSLPRTLTVPAAVAVAVPEAVRAVGALLARHESLRTRFRRRGDELHQETTAAGRLPVLVHAVPRPADDPDGRAAAAELTGRLHEPRFDHVAEWPLRVALVTVDNRVRQVVVVFSHSAVDVHAAQIVLRDLRRLLTHKSLDTPAGLQTLDLAERERHAELARSRRAVRYWVRQLSGLTPSLSEAVAPAADARHRRGALVSAAVHHAAQLVATRHRVSTASVLLAATAAALAGDGAQDACGIVVMANNRFLPGHDTAVGTLNQIGLCRLDLADRPGFVELLSRARSAALDAYRHAYYDPAEWERTVTELGHDHRSFLAGFCYLNDARLSRDADAEVPDLDEAALRALVSRSEFRWLPELAQFPWRCRVQVLDAPGAVELVVTANTRYFPAERFAPFLRTIETLLTEAVH
ncbi:condensation domain-containing protein [Micromonospora sp. WMMD1082]|uniref:condensation domain-containing protein n=1 Tax=Micromonospora sp. WMMD1082 TaxID=3016104 RepID=UPI002417630D|nr:condensation domain-containing protein [Micromonospora sp. WMMD1082]MDG4798023.1 condensation domain-containing protein [Micromonospora sp. WMMD1082]